MSYTIEVQIGERRYPVRVQSAQEERWVREAGRMLQEQYHELQLRIAGQEPVDYLAMSSLLLLAEWLRQGEQTRFAVQAVQDHVHRLLHRCEQMTAAPQENK
ncbi:MAG: cell division protein ZapA [Chitinophagales bacterium]|nr:cell division protein ZapA [Chitinophagales bacterium]MDW8393109.1 cell division protein ZapA [Chitinophagales bacterium]